MENILDQINSPKDLRQLDKNSLDRLAGEIRQRIIEVCAKNGGHLASNLGSVELTLALHYVFDTPNDKLIWDVSHQIYSHKLITGRRDQFHTIRQFEGLSGFARREESEYDVFNAAHAGTSIPAALAFAHSRDEKKESYKVIAVIGDGSLTAGMSFEGLNNAPSLDTDLIVVLNDNKMSISPNVGAISLHLNRIITGQLYNTMKEEMESFLTSIPGIGEQMSKFAHRVEEAVKGIFVPGRLFEDLGFKYVGPIDGHQLDHLIDTFESVQKLKGPILVHVVTQKGKGYESAEKDAVTYHGVSPFNVSNGKWEKSSGPASYTSVFGKTMVELANEDCMIVGITAAMKEGTGLVQFSREFPDRFFDVGIAEQYAVTFAAGLAAEGFKPVAAIYSTFLQRAYDQVIHDVCLMNHPVTFAMDRGGIVGADGPTHQGMYDVAYLRTLPNMVVMAPKDENELRHMMKTAVDYTGGPIAFRYPRGSGVGVPLDQTLQNLPIGKGELLQAGTDVLLIAYGHTVQPCLAASQELIKEGISTAVINARFVKPLDRELIMNWSEKLKRIVTVEESALMGGFGSAVLELYQEEEFWPQQMRRLGVPDVLVDQGPAKVFQERYRLDTEGVKRTVKEILQLSIPSAPSPGPYESKTVR